jgi:hypothetical protein
MGECRCLYLTPWNYVIGIRLVVSEPPIKFRFLGVSRGWNRVTFRDAIPKRFRQFKLVFDA